MNLNSCSMYKRLVSQTDVSYNQYSFVAKTTKWQVRQITIEELHHRLSGNPSTDEALSMGQTASKPEKPKVFLPQTPTQFSAALLNKLDASLEVSGFLQMCYKKISLCCHCCCI
jgi:hypothetical protein